MKNRKRALGLIAAIAPIAGSFLGASTAHAAAVNQLDGLSVAKNSVSTVHAFVRSHPAYFGGSYEDDATRTVYVLTTAGNAVEQQEGELAKIAGAKPSAAADPGSERWTVVTKPAKYTMASLNAVKDRITSSTSSFAEQAGNHLTTWYADPVSDTVHVGVTKVTPALRAAAKAEFGDEVTLVQEARHQSMDKLTPVSSTPRIVTETAGAKKSGQTTFSPSATTATRLLDSTPYAGGDRIVSIQTINGAQYVIQCTVNYDFTMDDGTAAMGTAGHCGATGVSWYQGYYDDSTKVIEQTGTMGSAYARIWGDNKTDAELLNDEGNPYGFWTQVYVDNTTLNNVGSVEPVSVGEEACSDGSFTGQNCAGDVTAVDVCENINDDGTIVKVCNLDTAVASTRLVQSGDSGGPVYLRSGSTLHPEGLISAGSTDGHNLDFSDIGFVDVQLGGYPETTT